MDYEQTGCHLYTGKKRAQNRGNGWTDLRMAMKRALYGWMPKNAPSFYCYHYSKSRLVGCEFVIRF